MANVAVLDWVILAVLLMSLLLGVWRGFVFELLSLAAWLCAFALAQWWGAEMGQLLPMAGASEPVRLAVGFILVFVGAIFAGGLLAVLARKLMAVAGLSPFDRALGAGFGLMRGLLVLLAASVLIAMTPAKTSAVWRESVGASLLSLILKGLRPILPHDYGKYLT